MGHGTLDTVHEIWYMVVWYMVVRYMEYGAWSTLHGVQYIGYGTWVSGTSHEVR